MAKSYHYFASNNNATIWNGFKDIDQYGFVDPTAARKLPVVKEIIENGWGYLHMYRNGTIYMVWKNPWARINKYEISIRE
jgi:hypothetical protein